MAEVGNVEPINIFERVGAVYDHMKYTGKYLEDGFNLVLSEMATRCVGRRDRQLLLEGRVDEEDLELDFEEDAADAYTHTLAGKLEGHDEKLGDIDTKLESLEGSLEGVDGKLKDMDAMLQGLEAKGQGILEMSVKITKKENPTTLLILTTLDGVPQKADIEIKVVDSETRTERVINYSSTALDDGKEIAVLEESSELFFVKGIVAIGDDGASAERTHLVSLD